jgi:hypothetical protein
MSIISVAETGNISATINEKWERTYQIELLVLSNSSLDGPGYIRNSVSSWNAGQFSHVAIGQTYVFNSESDTYALCLSVDARLAEQGSLANTWTVTATYGPWQPDAHAENPLYQAAEVQFDGETFTDIIQKDVLTGAVIKNTAGEQYDPPIEVEQDRLIFRVIRNEASPLNVATILGYSNKTNSDTWYGCDPKTVLSKRPTIERLWSQVLADDTGTGYYYKITYMFVYRPLTLSGYGDGGGWQRRVLDQGFNKLVSGVLTPITDTNGDKITTPSLLNGSGAVTTTEHYSTFDVLYTQDFGSTYNFAPDLFG